MGNTICARCCGDGGDALQMQLETLQGTDDSLAKLFRPEMLDTLHEGLSVRLILQDMARLECQLKLKEDNSSLVLSHGEKIRDVKLEGVQSVLHTTEQLGRVEGAAGIFPSDFCVAIRFVATGSCIPIFFQSLKEKNIFVITLAKIRTDSLKETGQKGSGIS